MSDINTDINSYSYYITVIIFGIIILFQVYSIDDSNTRNIGLVILTAYLGLMYGLKQLMWR